MVNDLEELPDNRNWASLVRQLLMSLGFYEVWSSQGVGNIDALLSVFKQRLNDTSMYHFFIECNMYTELRKKYIPTYYWRRPSMCHRSTMWLGSSVVKVLARYARGPGSSPGRAVCFFLPCGIWWLSVGPCSGCEQQRDCLVGSGMVPRGFGDESN